VEKAEIIDMDH